MAVYALRRGRRPLSSLYKTFPAFDRSPGLRETKCIYLDSAGLLASLGNKLLLRSPIPSKAQIEFWDRAMVPISRCTDRALNHAIGKSILGLWQKAS